MIGCGFYNMIQSYITVNHYDLLRSFKKIREDNLNPRLFILRLECLIKDLKKGNKIFFMTIKKFMNQEHIT